MWCYCIVVEVFLSTQLKTFTLGKADAGLEPRAELVALNVLCQSQRKVRPETGYVTLVLWTGGSRISSVIDCPQKAFLVALECHRLVRTSAQRSATARPGNHAGRSDCLEMREGMLAGENVPEPREGRRERSRVSVLNRQSLLTAAASRRTADLITYESPRVFLMVRQAPAEYP